ncbi:fibronectin type III domain-containing protein [Candidatus Parcubacteria bacterium]|nr:fibronectin type III domain-containing protein [Candidatus Parcubacteria bacterium]
MTKHSANLIFLSLILGFSFTGFSVCAQNGLEMQFEQDPLFTETNFLPGDSSDGWIKVENNGAEPRTISIYTDNVTDPAHLGDVLNLEIKEGASTLYSNTLSHLFSQTSIDLSVLANGAQTQYDLDITFALLAGNEYQGETLQFDLVIGDISSEEEEEDEDTTVTTLGVQTGTGGGVPITLKIFNVKSIDITENTATITWQTTLFATSQVIYSAEHESRDFNPDDSPYYGYAHIYPVPEDSAVKTFHTIILPDIEPCTDYYYRVVSYRISPYSLNISPEYEFTTLCVIGEEEEEEEKKEEAKEKKEEEKEKEEKIDEKIFIAPVEAAPEEPKEPEKKEEEPMKDEIVEEEIVEEPSPTPFLASLLAALKFPSCLPWWLILLFAIYPLIEGITFLQKSKKEYNVLLKKHFRKQGIIWLICCLIPIILAILMFLLECFCVPFWIFIVLALATLLAYWIDREITKRKFKKETV